MPKTSSNRTATVTIRVGPTAKDTIREYAKARDMTLGEFVRYCVWTYMDQTTLHDDPEQDMQDELAEWSRKNPEASRAGRRVELGEIRKG
jgi:hypothetical protein